MKRFLALIAVVALLAVAGCTDAERASWSAYGNTFRVTLYSGGQPVRTWISSGKVLSETSSDGWLFMDSETKRLVRVSGDSVVEQID